MAGPGRHSGGNKNHGGRLGKGAVKDKEGPMEPINGHAVQQPFKEEGGWVWWKCLREASKNPTAQKSARGGIWCDKHHCTLSQGHLFSRGSREGPSWGQSQLPLDPTISKLNQPLPATPEKKKQIKLTKRVGNIWAISCKFNTFSIKPTTNGKGSRHSHKGSLLPQAEGAAAGRGR